MEGIRPVISLGRSIPVFWPMPYEVAYLGNGVDPQPLRQGVEVGIAGLRNGFVDGEKAVMVVAFEEAAIKISAAIADDLHGFGHALLHAGRGHDDFEGRAGR